MKDITPLLGKNKKQIESYGNGGFKIAGEKFEGNIIILPESVHKFTAADIDNAVVEDLAPIIENADNIEVLLIGGGSTTEFFSKDVEKLMRSHRITMEYMDTGAAARTYNVLLSEERKVAVVLIAV